MASKKPVQPNAQQKQPQQTQPTRARRTRTRPAPTIPSHPAAFAATSIATRQCLSLSSEVCDLLAELMEMFKSYVALERFVVPEHEDEVHAGVPPSRGELGAMLRLFNGVILQQLHAVADTIAVLHAQMAINGALGGDPRSA